MEIETLNVDPKHLNRSWYSNDYRQWIHKNKICFCGRTLKAQDGHLHHHRNTGGKTPLDQFLTPFCASCHYEIHASANNREKLYKRLNVSDEIIRGQCALMLCEYLVDMGQADWVLNTLAEIARET